LNVHSSANDLSMYILRELAVALERTRSSVLIPRQDIDRALGTANLSASAQVTDAAARQAGRALNAQFVVTGSFERTGETYRFTVRLISVSDGAVQLNTRINVRENPHLRQLLGLPAPAAPAPASPPPVAAPTPAPAAPVPTPPPPAATPAPAVRRAPAAGTYTFRPRLRALRGGLVQAAYIDRIEIHGGFLNIFLIDSPTGVGNRWGDIPHYSTANSYIQDLDRPQIIINPVRSSDVEAGASRFRVVTFEGVQFSRFSLVNTNQTPHIIFEEIILGEPDS